jgi:hypothetical protein
MAIVMIDDIIKEADEYHQRKDLEIHNHRTFPSKSMWKSLSEAKHMCSMLRRHKNKGYLTQEEQHKVHNYIMEWHRSREAAKESMSRG